MAVDVPYHGILLKKLYIVGHIVEVGEEGIVVEIEHTAAIGDEAVEGGAQPVEVFLLHVSVAHLHVGAAVDTYEHERVDGGDEAVVAPEVYEGFCSALAPVVLMIAGEHEQRVPDSVESGFHVCELAVGALV